MTNLPLSHEKNATFTSSIIKVNCDNNPNILSKQQWAINDEDNLPECWTMQYKEALDEQYSIHLYEVGSFIQTHQQEIELTDIKCKKNVAFSQILLTVQATPFNGDIQLVLKTGEGDEVSLCSLKDLKERFDAKLIFEDQKINFAQTLNQRIPGFCLPSGQQLLLRVSGGILLTDNILLFASYT
ncbi:MAG: hypothetical protein OCD76_21925 [Reichenbachiella sp.]